MLPVFQVTGTTWFIVNKPSSVLLKELSGKTSQLPQPPGVTILSAFLTIVPVAVAVAKSERIIDSRGDAPETDMSNTALLPPLMIAEPGIVAMMSSIVLPPTVSTMLVNVGNPSVNVKSAVTPLEFIEPPIVHSRLPARSAYNPSAASVTPIWLV